VRYRVKGLKSRGMVQLVGFMIYVWNIGSGV